MVRSIRTRILFVTVICLIVTLCLNTSINYYVTGRDNQQSISDTLTSTSLSHSLTISDWVNGKMTMINSLQSAALSEDPVPVFRQVANAGGFINIYMGYTNKIAKFSDSTDIPAGYDPTIRPWYQQAQKDDAPIVTEPYVDAGTGKLIVTFAVPVKQNGILKGVVAGDVTLDSVIANVRSIRPTLHSSGLLFGDNGVLIASQDRAQAMKPLADTVRQVDIKQLINGSHRASGVVAGRRKELMATAIPGTHWHLMVALDGKDATSGMRSLLKASAIALLALVLISTAIVYLLISKVLGRLSTIRDGMHAIGSGANDLSQRLPETGQDEVTEIAQAFNAFSDKLARVMMQLRDSSASVNIAANEIATGNRDLSARTERAAASLRETASAVEQITASVANSNDATTQANTQAHNASKAAARGGEVVSRVITTMQAIELASGKIGDITSVIDSIAFQTNILALNASVEAARAGEQGRGFAVVAGEVRNLASRSAQAAKEIKSLIDSTTSSVADGSLYVREAGEAMDKIEQNVGSVLGIMREIALATDEQMKGIQEINHAVTNLDRMVQQNAELVVQSGAAAGALQSQAGELAETAGHFRI